MPRAAVATAGAVHAAIGLGKRDDARQIRCWKRNRVSDEHVGRDDHQRYWREIFRGVKWHFCVQGRVHCVRRECAHAQRVAVRCGFGDGVHADIAAGSRTVVDHDLLAQLLGEFLRQGARSDVNRATRWEWHN